MSKNSPSPACSQPLKKKRKSRAGIEARERALRLLENPWAEEDETDSVSLRREFKLLKYNVVTSIHGSELERLLEPSQNTCGGCTFFHWVGQALGNVVQALVVSNVLIGFGDLQVASGKSLSTPDQTGFVCDGFNYARVPGEPFHPYDDDEAEGWDDPDDEYDEDFDDDLGDEEADFAWGSDSKPLAFFKEPALRYWATSLGKMSARLGITPEHLSRVLRGRKRGNGDRGGLVGDGILDVRPTRRGLLMRPIEEAVVGMYAKTLDDEEARNTVYAELEEFKGKQKTWEAEDLPNSRFRPGWAEMKTRLRATNRSMLGDYKPVKCTFIDIRIMSLCRGHPAAAVLLAQSIYWQFRADIVRRSLIWFKKSIRDWVRELGIPHNVVLENIAWLKERGFIQVKEFPWKLSRRSKDCGRLSLHIHVDHKAIAEALADV